MFGLALVVVRLVVIAVDVFTALGVDTTASVVEFFAGSGEEASVFGCGFVESANDGRDRWDLCGAALATASAVDADFGPAPTLSPDEFDAAGEAIATPQPMKAAAPMPSATASPPMRPIYLEAPMASSRVDKHQ